MKEIDDKKVAFISCVNDDKLYSWCRNNISRLEIPDGYSIKTIAIYDADSMCWGYNKAMNDSAAKYKVYLHQDTFIINPFFIHEMLGLFSEPTIGLFGMIGSLQIPESGAWWDAKYRYGQVIDTTGPDFSPYVLQYADRRNNQMFKGSTDMAILDGLILVTQYDLPWRDDLFKWHFYDASQCLEFYKAGYRVCVPDQKAPWCFHYSGIPSMEGYGESARIFLTEYEPYIIKQRQEFEQKLKQKKTKRILKEFTRIRDQFKERIFRKP